MSGNSSRRRGGALLAALVLLAVILLMMGAMLQQLAATQRAARLGGQKLQAQWLAESALDRAIAQRQLDSSYTGETWRPPSATAGEPGVARIEIQKVDDEDVVTITADYPDHPQHRARVQLRRRMP